MKFTYQQLWDKIRGLPETECTRTEIEELLVMEGRVTLAEAKEYEIWNYPLIEETLYVTDWTTSNTNILWHYYETVKEYL